MQVRFQDLWRRIDREHIRHFRPAAERDGTVLAAIIRSLNDVGDTSTGPAEVAALKSNESEVADWSFGRWWDSARTLWHPQMIQ
ncbi:hypothetical protein MITS9509_01782 [Synechococcus sp. MIT S9509]|nr:hypothetical protein MITS9504_03416 [Synechococcus sp. MIT S9504]KZR91861.1 hypothetical protein MITS9509_01782 [Synechococcus sp. MIT S9509]